MIRSGSGTVVATANLSKVIELTADIAYKNYRKMEETRLSYDEARGYEGLYAWVLEDVVKFKNPVPYKHPFGAVTWVTLDEPTTKKVFDEALAKKNIVYSGNTLCKMK